MLCTSRQPLLDAAWVLLSEGVHPETPLEARHAGSAVVALRSTVGEAARWMVEESDRDGLRRRTWRPFAAPIATMEEVHGTAPPHRYGVAENTRDGIMTPCRPSEMVL